MQPSTRSNNSLTAFLTLALLAAARPCKGARPSPLPADLLVGTDAFQGATDMGEQSGREFYNRRQLLLHDEQFAAELAADEAAEAAEVGRTWGFHLEEMVAQLASRGAALQAPEQQQEAVDSLAGQFEGLAAQVITATRTDIAALRVQLRATVPSGISAGAMSTLLQSPAFQGKLKAALDEAMGLVGAELEPYLSDVALTVHSTLRRLVLEGQAEGLEALPVFSDSFLPSFATSFSLSIVEATLLRTLWRDT